MRQNSKLTLEDSRVKGGGDVVSRVIWKNLGAGGKKVDIFGKIVDEERLG